MTITENDFIEKMIEIAKTGYENMTQLQCVFFTENRPGRKPFHFRICQKGIE